MNKFKSLLISLKLFDPDQTLSLSNLAFMILCFKLATSGNIDWAILTGFMITMLNHNSKKWFAKNKADREAKQIETQSHTNKELEAIKAEVKALTQIVNLRNR